MELTTRTVEVGLTHGFLGRGKERWHNEDTKDQTRISL